MLLKTNIFNQGTNASENIYR